MDSQYWSFLKKFKKKINIPGSPILCRLSDYFFMDAELKALLIFKISLLLLFKISMDHLVKISNGTFFHLDMIQNDSVKIQVHYLLCKQLQFFE